MTRTIGTGSIDLLMEAIETEGWSRAEREEGPTTVDGSFAWRTLATHREGSRLILCEAGVRREFPDYFERRAWSRGVGAEPRDLLLITDAAHHEFVLAGSIEVACRMIYGEELLGEGPDALVEPLRRFRERQATTCFGEADETVDAERAIAAAIRGRLPPRSRPRDVLELDPTDWVASCNDAGAVRALWRVLGRITIVDGDCRSPGWLLAAACFLEACYLATLSRLESFLIDEITRARPTEVRGGIKGGARRKAPYGGDDHRRPWRELRKSLFGQRWDGFRRPDRAELRGEIVRRQIVGFTRSAGEAASCRQRLLSYVGDPRPRFPSLDTNVRCAVWRIRDECTQHVDDPNIGAIPFGLSLENRKDVRSSNSGDHTVHFASGWRLIADARARDGWTVDEWRRACRDLRRARARIERLAVRGGTTTDPAVLDPRLLAPGFQPGNLLVVRQT